MTPPTWAMVAAMKYVEETDYIKDESRRIAGNAFLAGLAAGLQAAIDEVERWGRAYPEDVFTPLPKYGTPEQEAQDNVLVTRASAHMGRHMSKKLAEDLRALLPKGEG